VTWNYRWIGAVAIGLSLATSPAKAQWYGGGYWGGYGGGQTVQGSELQGAGMYAMGMGRYNVESAQARSINADTAMRWNQYMYESKMEAQRIWAEKENREQAKQKGNYKAIQDRVRNNPTQDDIAKGNALNIISDELSNPKLFKNAVYYGMKVKVGGEDIRDIPFQYASAAISTSVHQLTQGNPPAALMRDEFGPDRDKIKAVAAELRQEGQELGTHKPETIKKAKDQIMATKAKVEATFPQNSQERRDAEKYIRAIYGLASMLETPAVNVLLAGVEKRPEATLGDLMDFMATYNLRFGAAETTRQRAVYMKLYPVMAKLRDEVVPVPGSNPPPGPIAGPTVPGEVFEGIGYNTTETKTPPPPPPAAAPKP
jgi:hypothetical protein